MYRPKNRVAKYYVGTANAKPMFNEGALLMGKTTASTNHNGTHTSSVAERFGEELRSRCDAMGIGRAEFVARASKKFPKIKNRITFVRWFNGKKLPQTKAREWFAKEFSIEVPDTRDGEVRILAAAPVVDERSPDELMAYAVGSLQTAIKSSDDDIVHDVQDSLKDPKQNPWMRIAVTLIRQAHRTR
jgi:hypothetical protein